MQVMENLIKQTRRKRDEFPKNSKGYQLLVLAFSDLLGEGAVRRNASQAPDSASMSVPPSVAAVLHRCLLSAF